MLQVALGCAFSILMSLISESSLVRREYSFKAFSDICRFSFKRLLAGGLEVKESSCKELRSLMLDLFESEENLGSGCRVLCIFGI